VTCLAIGAAVALFGMFNTAVTLGVLVLGLLRLRVRLFCLGGCSLVVVVTTTVFGIIIIVGGVNNIVSVCGMFYSAILSSSSCFDP